MQNAMAARAGCKDRGKLEPMGRARLMCLQKRSITPSPSGGYQKYAWGGNQVVGNELPEMSGLLLNSRSVGPTSTLCLRLRDIHAQVPRQSNSGDSKMARRAVSPQKRSAFRDCYHNHRSCRAACSGVVRLADRCLPEDTALEFSNGAAGFPSYPRSGRAGGPGQYAPLPGPGATTKSSTALMLTAITKTCATGCLFHSGVRSL